MGRATRDGTFAASAPMVALVGPAGSGRTRLARLSAPHAVEVRCFGGLAHLTYGALAEAVPGVERGPDPVPVVDAVRRHADGGPVLLADLDRADASTVGLVERLADHLPLLVTIDPDGPEGARALEVAETLGAAVLETSPLDDDEARAIAAQANPDLDADALARVAAAARGSVVAVEVLARLGEAGSLEDAVAEYLGRLDVDTRCSALTLAVVDRPGREVFLPGVDRLVADGIACWFGPGHVHLQHRLVGDAILAALGTGGLEAIHEQVATVLAVRDPGGAARHALAAGDRRRAAELARLAAGIAPDPIERALDLEVAAHATGDQLAAVEAAAALADVGHTERAEALLAAADDERTDVGARAAVVLARIEAARGDGDAARDRLQRAIASCGGAAPAEAALRVELATIATANSWQAGAAVDLARDARAAVQRAGLDDAPAAGVLARALLAAGRPPSDPEAAEALATALAGPDDGGLAAEAAYTACTYHGDLREAIALARRQVDVARRHGQHSRALTWRLWGANLAVTGLADYGEPLDELLRLQSEPLLAPQREHLDACTIAALSDLGREGEWRRLYQERWAGRPTRPLLRWAVATAEFNAGRFGVALAAAQHGRGTSGAVEPLVELIERWALLLRRQPVPGPLPDPGVPNLAAVVPESEALAARAAGDHAAAIAAYATAAEQWRDRMSRNAWRCQLGEAECRRLIGDVDGAVELLTALADDAAAHGLVVVERRARDGLRRCGAVPTARPDAILTAREHALLLRVAAGATSVDIAAELHVAVRTVDKTIARAMRKLGARTRHQAAGIVVGGGAARPAATPDVELAADTRVLLVRLVRGDTISTAARVAGMSRRTATRRLAELRAELGVASTAAVLDALADRL